MPRREDRAQPFRRPARGRALSARRGLPRLARRHEGPRGLPECVCKARRAGDDRQRLRFSPPAAAAVIGGDGRCVAALCRGCHREFRRQPLHVREQLPGRQGRLQLSGAVERVQAARERRLGVRKRPIFSPAPHRGSTGCKILRPHPSCLARPPRPSASSATARAFRLTPSRLARSASLRCSDFGVRNCHFPL